VQTYAKLELVGALRASSTRNERKKLRRPSTCKAPVRKIVFLEVGSKFDRKTAKV
jgi:hypothetical protein